MFTKFKSDQIFYQIRWYVKNFVAVFLMNIPILSYGMALGWVSLASGGVRSEGIWDTRVMVAATVTFLASLFAIPATTKVLLHGRRPTIIASSVLFTACWSLKLVANTSVGYGTWWVVVGRAAGGVAGAAAWCATPLMVTECVSSAASAVSSAAAHNAGMLFMYIGAALRVDHNLVLWSCLAVSVVHVVLMLWVPESPAFLAACGRHKEALRSLAWLNSTSVDDPILDKKLNDLPPPEIMPTSIWSQSKEMFKSRARKRAFFISCFAVIGQEVSGVLALLQYAERTLTSGSGAEDTGGAGRAVVLGAVQLVASLLALPLIDRVGRKPLLLCAAFTTAACLCAGAATVSFSTAGAAAALAVAVAADAIGLQTVPYALLSDMFHYQFRGCALTLAAAAAALGNAAEVFIFPAAASAGGVVTSLAAASTTCLIYAVILTVVLPETRGRSLDEIYEEIAPSKDEKEETICTRI